MSEGLFILGGSSFYTLLMLQSLAASGVAARFDRIALFGRDRERLALVAELGAGLVGPATRLIATDRIEDSLDPAYTILFNQIRFGGLDARDGDERAAIEAGLPADETIGVVGVTNAIRAITGVAALADVLAAKTGPYRLVNFTNPCSIVCQYLTRRLDAPVIGVCDYPAFMRRTIARALGASETSVEIDTFGLNHFGFIHGVRVDGEDRFDAVKRAALAFQPACDPHFATILNPSWSFALDARRVAARQAAAPNRTSALIEIETALTALMRSEARTVAPYLDLLARRACDWYDLAVTPVLGQMTGDAAAPVFVNCAAGDVLDLGERATVVEASARVTPAGAAIEPPPERLRTLPEFRMVQLAKQAELMLLDAILARNAEGIVAACLVNPMIGALGPVEAYLADVRARDPLIDGVLRGDA